MTEFGVTVDQDCLVTIQAVNLDRQAVERLMRMLAAVVTVAAEPKPRGLTRALNVEPEAEPHTDYTTADPDRPIDIPSFLDRRGPA